MQNEKKNGNGMVYGEEDGWKEEMDTGSTDWKTRRNWANLTNGISFL